MVEGALRQDRARQSQFSNLSDHLAASILHGLKAGSPVAAGPLERRLLLLSDVPGVLVRSTLSPGSEVGSSDLTVALTPGPRFSGSIDGDNAGDPFSGAYRLGATMNINDPTGHGDLISLRVLSSFDGLNYGRVAYQTQVQDATVGVAFAALDYRLHGAFTSLRASGTAEVASVFASYPLVRSYDNNLALLGDFDDRVFQDKEGAVASVTDKDEYAMMVGIAGDHHDTLAGGGWDQFSLGYTFGELDIRTPAARLFDATTARADGGYGKLSYSVSRLQTVAGPLSVYGLVRGQLASKNLDISEKMELGGAYAVRAYPEGLIYGDDGYLATFEVRLLLPPPPAPIPGRLRVDRFHRHPARPRSTTRPGFPAPTARPSPATGSASTGPLPITSWSGVAWAHTYSAAPRGVPGPLSSSRGSGSNSPSSS